MRQLSVTAMMPSKRTSSTPNEPLHHITDRAARDLHATLDVRGAPRQHLVTDGADQTGGRLASGVITGLQRVGVIALGILSIGIGK